jgi:hypothetical protein
VVGKAKAMQPLLQSTASSLALAAHGETWEWKEVELLAEAAQSED